MISSKSVGWQELNRAAEAEGVNECLDRMDRDFIYSMTLASIQSMLVAMHNPKPDRFTLDTNAKATLGLARLLFDQWDESGFTDIVVKLAPMSLALNPYARAQLFALEQEMLSPLCIPVEAWGLIWSDFDRKAVALGKELAKDGFRFSDAVGKLEKQSQDPEDQIQELAVPGGHRVLGTGLPLRRRDADASVSQLVGLPTIFHYSPFSWRKFFAVAGSIVVGALNTTAAVPTAGVAVASVATAAAVGGYWAGEGDV